MLLSNLAFRELVRPTCVWFNFDKTYIKNNSPTLRPYLPSPLCNILSVCILGINKKLSSFKYNLIPG